MSKWSGPQDADGNELQNYRDETLAAVPAYVSPDDAGRRIWVSTAGADYGPWVGDDDTGDWVRPSTFGGSGGGYAEPGLLMWVDPRPLVGFGNGFDPLSPAFVILSRPLTAFEVLYLQMSCDDGGLPAIVGAGNLGVTIALGPGTVTAQEVWWDQKDGLGPFFVDDSWSVNLLVNDLDSGNTMDVITVDVEGPPF